MNFRSEIEESKDHLFLLLTSFLFFLLRLPSLFEPIWYGDEGIYQVLGMAIRHGRLLYSQIWDNKPPLLYVLYGMFSSDQFALRLVSLITGIISIIVFFYLCKTLLPKKNSSQYEKPIYVATLAFAILFGLPLLEGNIANAENFMLLPILFSAFLIFRYVESKKRATLFYSGILLAIAFLFKIIAIFDFAAFSVFLFIFFYKNREVKNLVVLAKKLIPLFAGFAFPILVTFLFFLIKGALNDFFGAVFVQNVGYVGWGNKLFIPHGLLIAKIILLGAWNIFIFRRKKVLTQGEIFTFVWVSFATFNAFFSQRPYTHYMLVLLPSFCLLITMALKKQAREEPKSNNSQRTSFALLTALLILLLSNFNFYKKSISYYGNFLAFITHQKDMNSYQAFFDRNTPNDYALSQYINMHAKKEDTLFIWGNNAQVYNLTKKLPPGRFTVMYHITRNKETLKETQEVLQKTKPTYLLITSWDTNFPFFLPGYKQRFSVGKSILYERSF